MASNTPNLNLYKKDPIIDGNDTFNIKTMLNDNWDKIDAEVTAKVDKVDFSSHLADDAYQDDTGTASTYVITLSHAPTAYKIGQRYSFKAKTANTGVSTLNINSLGAKTIKKNVSTDLTSGDIIAGQIVTVVYDGTNFQFIGVTRGDFNNHINNNINHITSAERIDWNSKANAKRLTATQLNDTKLPAGIYANNGDGILNNDGTMFKSSWWHVIVCHHYNEDGFGAQIAIPLSQPSDIGIYIRRSSGTTWGAWRMFMSEDHFVPTTVAPTSFIGEGVQYQVYS